MTIATSAGQCQARVARLSGEGSGEVANALRAMNASSGPLAG
ncbi:hypothetical protein ACS15_2017 [Ralstonia insidiosa]|uniref:Uncharacterized protein n=1 Tax=Ralstonia insidiosa TaxID=190721 RepID=A0AAC9FQE2_9RALS|nr:hypothetical protein ACS15_2017 [Ralstonia insidiosa]